MGHWGYQSWENDSAADWLDQFAEQAEIEKRIRDGLSLSVDCIDKVRAAANLLLAMSKLQCVSGNTRKELASLAIERLSSDLESGEYEAPEFRTAVLDEIAQLRELVSSSRGGSSLIHQFIHKKAKEQFGLTLYEVTDFSGTNANCVVKDLVGTGYLDQGGVLHLELTDGRDEGFLLRCRCVPADGTEHSGM